MDGFDGTGEERKARAVVADHPLGQGVYDVSLNQRSRNVLIEFDPALTDEPCLLTLIAGAPTLARAHRSRHPPTNPESGWLRARRSETMHARPGESLAALLDFERYPQ